MKQLVTRSITFLCLLSVLVNSKSEGQTIQDKFEYIQLSETFDSIGSHWEIAADMDNLLIIQDGEYILNRKATNAPYAILSNHIIEVRDYRLIFSIRLEKGLSENSSLGVIFMAQPGAGGGYIFEINHLQQYRLKQIVNGSYKYISNEGKNSGWSKTLALKETNTYNFIEVKTMDGKYELYINNIFQMSFEDIKTIGGKLGLVVGPASQGRFDFIYLFSKNSSNKVSESKQNNDLVSLAESIIQLKTQINTLNEENDVLKKTIQAMNIQDNTAEKEKKEFENKILSLKSEIKALEKKNDSIATVNTELEKYKNIVAGNENSDLIISLSKSLKAEREENSRLQELLKINGITDNKQSRQEKQKAKESTFTLPKEN